MPRKQHTVIKMDCGYSEFLVNRLPEVLAKNGVNPELGEHREFLITYCSADYYLNLAMVGTYQVARNVQELDATNLMDMLTQVSSEFAFCHDRYSLPVNYMMQQFVFSQRSVAGQNSNSIKRILPLIEERTTVLIQLRDYDRKQSLQQEQAPAE